ncbi:hypothetical protein GCM10009687_58730 [Asanoa iriomotensis]
MLLALAGCGGESDAAGASGTDDGGFTAYRDCLSQHGITLPSGQPGAGQGRPSGFPSGRPEGFPSGRPEGFPSGRPSGFPSGGPGAGGPGGGFGGLRPEGVSEEQWQQAQEACASVRPSMGPGGQGDRRGGGNRGADTAYRNCLSDHGATPGTTPSAEAEQACAVLRPTPTPTA